jgi:hypothetical protein
MKVGKKKKTTRLMVQVIFADTGVVEETFVSPFQKPVYTNIKVTVRNSHSSSVPNLVVLTAKQGKQKVTRTFAV